jgi:tRNA (cmo5U34)-methyltransferase
MTWTFNRDVAIGFKSHAEKHIPGYIEVINKSVNVCERLLKKEARIIDVGCAIGETLRELHCRGFTNLHGSESSIDMLNECPKDLNIKYYNSDLFPDHQFDGILCNWTLHFIKNKEDYLLSMIHALSNSGVLILSEKTSIDPFLTEMYYQYKRDRGTSEEEIAEKRKRLEGVMNINQIDWYLTFFKEHDLSYSIIAADFCFTTFIVRKNVLS